LKKNSKRLARFPTANWQEEMKTPAVLKTLRKLRVAFSVALVVAMLIILPRFDGTAMVVGSAIGLAAQVFLYPEPFRGRSGSMTMAICLVVALSLVAAVILAISLVIGHWD
jgi:predicted permease